MKTYKDLLIKLESIGFKDISRNYSGGTTLLHVGYGRNKDPWPRHQLQVFRTQEGSDWTGGVYFQDWLKVGGRTPIAINSLEAIWLAAMELATEAMTPQKAA